MARVGCVCGNILSNTNCPSEDIIHVYLAEKAEGLLKDDPSLTLWDFYSNHKDGYDFWYCRECKRVYVFKIRQAKGGSFIRIAANEAPVSKLDGTWKELYVFTDVDIDVTTDLDMAYPLKDYLQRERKYRYWYNEAEQLVLAYAGDKLAFAYKQEWPIP